VRRDELLPAQLAVVESRAPVTLVLGGPGTGKTTVASWVAREAIEIGEVGPSQRVLFLTFSRTATRRVDTRATQIVGTGRDQLEMMTFHAFGLRLLRAYGRYDGRGPLPLTLHTPARRTALADLPPGLEYDDLVPGALSLLRSERLRRLASARWPVIVCDEFQDTHDDQWEVLQLLGQRSRLVLLADPDQMIYDYQPGVSPERIDQARALAGDAVITLERASLRDPTMVVPDAARAIRLERYDDPAVKQALTTGRLRVLPRIGADDLPATVRAELDRLRAAGRHDVAVMRAVNADVATLSHALHEVGVDNDLCGLPEAHIEAMAAMAEFCTYGVDQSDGARCRRALAVYMAAATRKGNNALLTALASGGPLRAQPGLERAIADLEGGLVEAAGAGSAELLDLALESFLRLPLRFGIRPWRLAAQEFRGLTGLARRRPVHDLPELLTALVDQRRDAVLSTKEATGGASVQLMVLHQAKGREADACIIVIGHEWAWRDEKSAPRQRRVLYVAMTRARHEVVVILEPNPTSAVRPLLTAAKNAGVAT
jgi:DNA helicase II / ATP-dependent DNA helicase PcrA